MSNQEARAKSLNAFARIYKSRGIKGIWLHLLNLWFDFIRGVDTVERYKSAGIQKSYVTTAQSAIKKSIENAINFLNKNENSVQINFIELGVGKGKVIIIMKEIILKKFNKDVNILGIELDNNLCNIFRKNLKASGFKNLNKEVFILKNSRNLVSRIKVQLLNEDIQNRISEVKITENTKYGQTIYYCCDSQNKESILKLIKQIIKNKKLSNQKTVFIYSNPRYLNTVITKFRNEVEIIMQDNGGPQKSYAILNIL